MFHQILCHTVILVWEISFFEKKLQINPTCCIPKKKQKSSIRTAQEKRIMRLINTWSPFLIPTTFILVLDMTTEPN
ncbi:unknown [Ruminococcus sp. CAG:403]|nr:unknown [Ruminococcus sp. CAG:403]